MLSGRAFRPHRCWLSLLLLSGSTALIPWLLPDRHVADKSTAQEVAKAWLRFVDEGAYEQSWTASAAYFQTSLSCERWCQVIQSVRQPLGQVISRQLASCRYTRSLPGAPAGAYVVIQYRTSFTQKPHAVETITPMQDSDGIWRVSGYYIN